MSTNPEVWQQTELPVTADEISKPSRSAQTIEEWRSVAAERREVEAHWATCLITAVADGWTHSEIARAGGVTRPAVTQSATRIRRRQASADT
ncbi:hypothetical protein [Actinotalea sp. C106]|uniref:hypothetical protein n=1 Tax=Actinotalea sp. C106 TaxID=2908644 RepID=UPI002027EDCC|nr:hypothetical protein [Actinotalea sp. C106]